jgi:hypothetical protein
MGHAEAQDLSPLATGADHPAAAIAEGVAFRRPPGVFPAGSVAARKDDAPAAGQAAITNIASVTPFSGGGGLIQTTSG